MDNVLFTLVKKWRKELVPEHGPFVRGILSEEFTALSNTIKCHTVSSVDDSPALIIFPFSISSLELTLNVFFLLFFWVSMNQRYHPAEMLSFQENIHA